MRTTIGLAAVALALTFPAAGSSADEKAPVSADDLAKAFAEASKPGPEHAKLTRWRKAGPIRARCERGRAACR